MRQISPFAVWLGHVGDTRDWRMVFDVGIQAIVDLAGNEPPASPPRDLIYCRFPLVDGAGNSVDLLEAAVTTLEHFIRTNIRVLVYCSAGLSRTPAVAAAALARVTGQSLDESLAIVQRSGSADISPGLWASLQSDLTSRHSA
ncbi:MAG: dual specificity protein phosphatase family protein [Planctomycetia bacterium]|nr:dual specificity protein phosphatase family protein [Planctomycetia bacterium]